MRYKKKVREIFIHLNYGWDHLSPAVNSKQNSSATKSGMTCGDPKMFAFYCFKLNKTRLCIILHH